MLMVEVTKDVHYQEVDYLFPLLEFAIDLTYWAYHTNKFQFTLNNPLFQ